MGTFFIVVTERIRLKERFVQITSWLLFKTKAHGMLIPRMTSWILINIIESLWINRILTTKRKSFGLFVKLLRLIIRSLAKRIIMIRYNLKHPRNVRVLLCSNMVAWRLEKSLVPEIVHGVTFHFKKVLLTDIRRWTEIESSIAYFGSWCLGVYWNDRLISIYNALSCALIILMINFAWQLKWFMICVSTTCFHNFFFTAGSWLLRSWFVISSHLLC